MNLYFKFIPTLTKHNKLYTHTPRPILLQIDEEEHLLAIDDAAEFKLSEGTHYLQSKLGPVPTYFPPVFQYIFNSFPQPKSDCVCYEVKLEDVDSTHYFISYNMHQTFWATLAYNFSRWGHYLQFEKPPEKFSLFETTKNDFYKQIHEYNRLQNKLKRQHKLSPQGQKLTLYEMVVNALALPFGIYILCLPIHAISMIGFLLCLGGTGPILRLCYYIRNHHISSSYRGVLFRSLIDGILYISLLVVLQDISVAAVLAFVLLISRIYMLLKVKTVFKS